MPSGAWSGSTRSTSPTTPRRGPTRWSAVGAHVGCPSCRVASSGAPRRSAAAGERAGGRRDGPRVRR
eukprot:1062187-Prymnesium_polylepis.1